MEKGVKKREGGGGGLGEREENVNLLSKRKRKLRAFVAIKQRKCRQSDQIRNEMI